MWGIFGSIALGLALVFGVALPWANGWIGFSPRYNPAAILREVQSLSQLVTVKYVIEKPVVFQDSKWLGPFLLGENRLTLIAHGVVKAGVDLEAMRPDDVRIEGQKVYLTLPHAIVTDAYLDEQRTEVMDWKTGFLRTFDKDLEQNARRQAITEILRTARKEGIEAEANERARLQITHLLKQAGMTDVEIDSR